LVSGKNADAPNGTALSRPWGFTPTNYFGFQRFGAVRIMPFAIPPLAEEWQDVSARVILCQYLE
jgi:tRNA(Glu) U13 pseudouridine synthase TruD